MNADDAKAEQYTLQDREDSGYYEEETGEVLEIVYRDQISEWRKENIAQRPIEHIVSTSKYMMVERIVEVPKSQLIEKVPPSGRFRKKIIDEREECEKHRPSSLQESSPRKPASKVRK